MLEQKDNELSMTVTTKSIFQSEENSTSRIAYKLVRVGEDGTVLPATEDEVMQVESFVDRDSVLARSDAEASDIALQNEDNIEMSEDKEGFSYQDDENMKILFTGKEDLEEERRRLLARLEVLDSMLSKAKNEPQKHSKTERINGDSSRLYSNLSRTNGKYKRQRRPNPKYLNANARKELSPALLPTTNSTAGGAANSFSAGLNISHSLLSYDILEKNAVLSPGVSNCLPSHICKKGVVDVVRPLILNLDVAEKSHERPKDTSSLDNLSIRELHEAFKTTFGRETSVKDKHWLKRQISMGMTRLQETTNKDVESGGKVQALVQYEPPLQARVEPFAEPPALYCSVKANDKILFEGLDGVIDVPYLNRRPDHESDISGSISELFPEKTTSSPVTGATSSISYKSGSANLLTYVVEGQSTEGKRQRKPNRRYMEDEVDGVSLTGNAMSMTSTTDPSHEHIFSKVQLRPFSNATTDVTADMSRLSSLRSSSTYISSRSGIFEGHRGKVGRRAQKRKAESRAAKLVKMARSARSYQHNADNNVRRVKFKLPKTSDQDKNKAPESYDERSDQVSCLLPAMSDSVFGNLPSKDPEPYSSGDSELVAMVPTANGGTRRKHHRPWTLREVMTLVDGVARCGGGKWADIKKLAFSSVSYRTAVDLKDKWRNLLRASRSQFHSAKQGANRKRHFSVSIPGPILARVRELAALQNQTAGIPLVTATIRSGRLVQRR